MSKRYFTTVKCKDCGKTWEKRTDTILEKYWSGRCRNCLSPSERLRRSERAKELLKKIGKIKNSGKNSPRGENNYRWKGGKPKCIDCGKQLSKYGAVRCQKHANWIITRSFIGKKLSKGCRVKMKASWSYDKHITPHWLKKQSEIRRGEKTNFWRGGISFKPYPYEWTEIFKRKIRERDNYTCKICGKELSKYIHHIDYDKNNCKPENLITLCLSCHAKTSFNRDYWIKYFAY